MTKHSLKNGEKGGGRGKGMSIAMELEPGRTMETQTDLLKQFGLFPQKESGPNDTHFRKMRIPAVCGMDLGGTRLEIGSMTKRLLQESGHEVMVA